jgi:RNA polymerase subunit RPABC4/transcription elongation factor Spt4
MSKVECPSCAMEVDFKNKTCPVCGYEFTSKQTRLKWVALVLAIFLLLIYLFF